MEDSNYSKNVYHYFQFHAEKFYVDAELASAIARINCAHFRSVVVFRPKYLFFLVNLNSSFG